MFGSQKGKVDKYCLFKSLGNHFSLWGLKKCPLASASSSVIKSSFQQSIHNPDILPTLAPAFFTRIVKAEDVGW